MQDSNSNALTWVLGGALVLIGLFVVILLVSVNSQADDVTTSTTVSNIAPVVDTVDVKQSGASVVGSSITLSSGGVTSVSVEGQITDDNGVNTTFANGDLARVEALLFRTGGPACNSGATDNNNCYYEDSTDNSCTITATSATTVNYTCVFDSVQFYADSTTAGGTDPTGSWKATVTAIDDSSGTHSKDSGLTDVATLLSLSIPATINYGTLSLGQSTIAQGPSQDPGDNRKMTITQYGNDEADVEVSSSAAMACQNSTTIPVANQQWSLTDLSYNPSGTGNGRTELSGTPTDTNLAVGYMTVDGTPVTKDLYWNILIPSTNVTGSCIGTTIIAAIAS